MQTLIAQLQPMLQQQVTLLTQLDEILKQEFDALKNNALDSLTQLLDTKYALLSQIEQLEATRMALLKDLSVPPTKQGFEDLLQKLATESLNTLWQSLLEKLPACQKQNEVNGHLLQIKRQNNEQILSLLTGKSSMGGELYTAQGNRNRIQQSGLYTSA